MGKVGGFLEYKREESMAYPVSERVKSFKEFHKLLAEDKVRCQAGRCMDCGVAFCQAGMTIGNMASGCPLNNLIPEWNDLIYQGQWEEAYRRLSKTSNFPEFTSRVCPALCEKACVCNLHDEPVTVRENERAIIENAFAKGYVSDKGSTFKSNKRVAVIGSGPAGLAAADLLNKRGHTVIVYERDDKCGGLLRYGIPNMKLEKEVIDRRLLLMEKQGVTFLTGVNVGVDITSGELLKDYDAVILACGAKKPRDVSAPGRDAKGIYYAVDYLSDVTRGIFDKNHKSDYLNVAGKNVVIVGGGDTGNDCMGTVIRLGCKSVVQLEFNPKPPVERAQNNPWPQWPLILKTDYGQEEAISLWGEDPRKFETTVKEFRKDSDGNLKEIVTVKVKMETVDDKRVVSQVPDSEEVLPADVCLIAAGFVGCENYVAEEFGVDITARGNVKVEGGLNSHKTAVNKLFVAGDMRRGQSLVVWAIREGRDVALEVDKELLGYTNLG